ncbi:imidazole glycerol phosphate synthase subunit HisH [Candidatus Falkowbacteria bacterium]|nr:imidazole glycerol phosphate synthase subunit HisH [Candidatus Falkowbacteria bacterium]
MGQDKVLAIIDYQMGNVRSAAKAFELLGVETVVSNKFSDIQKASHLVLPGVGAFGDGMKHLNELGLIDILKDEVLEKKKPILGICLGMQLLGSDSEEFGRHQGLGFLKAPVKEFNLEGKDLKVPHVGWNNIRLIKDHPLFSGIKQDSVFYFVHSFHLVPEDGQITAATCNYGYDFPAIVAKENIFAVQFHPEKSQTVGLKMLENFINWDGK